VTTAEALKWLERNGTRATRDGLARYGIQAKQAFGITMGQLLKYRKTLGTDHDLALGLWDSGWYEARLLASLIGDPQRLTVRQMNAWAAGFENWGDCDTVCFQLFDRSPHAWGRAAHWARSPREFVKRGGFALMACLALHDKAAPDAKLRAFLPLVERGAPDERNFVKKGVSWALRSLARRKGLKTEAVALARQLAESEEPAARWVGKDALREFARAKR
jgi:3-methyladenine DNA glycosylase AlkD